MKSGTPVTRDQKLRAVAKAFMADDPAEYAGETVEDVIEHLKQTSDEFINRAYEWFVAPAEKTK